MDLLSASDVLVDLTPNPESRVEADLIVGASGYSQRPIHIVKDCYRDVYMSHTSSISIETRE